MDAHSPMGFLCDVADVNQRKARDTAIEERHVERLLKHNMEAACAGIDTPAITCLHPGWGVDGLHLGQKVCTDTRASLTQC